MSKTLTIRLTNEQAEMIDDLKVSLGLKAGTKVIIDCLKAVHLAQNYKSPSMLMDNENKYTKLIDDHARLLEKHSDLLFNYENIVSEYLRYKVAKP